MAFAAAPPRYQKLRGGGTFSFSEDSAMVNQIQTIHAPDGREVDLKPLLHVIENIMNRSGPTANVSQAQAVDATEENVLHVRLGEMLELVSNTIHKISCEMSCKCLGGSEAHATTLAIFHLLASYTWEAKVVIALAAFAVNHGQFWLVVQLYLTDPLAKSVALLKQLPDINLERADSLKPKFEALTTLIQAMLNVTACIVEFKELPAQYIEPDTPALLTAKAHYPVAVYWTIRSIVACASLMLNLVGMGQQYTASMTEAWELSSMAHKLSNIHSHLQQPLALCNQHINENKLIEEYQKLVSLFGTPHMDNMEILRALIDAREDQLPLIDGSTKRPVSIDVLRSKIVLLLISDLDLADDEIFILQQIYTDARQDPTREESQYEVVWLPVVDRSRPWDSEKETHFKLQDMMPWYSVFDPSQMDPAVLKYIKEAWHFNKKPLLVVLDPHGRVVNYNAIHMLLIWGSLAFPFTSVKEEWLWKQETWKMDLLADSVHPLLFEWISEGKYICLYGGEDIEWIRRFTASLKAVAKSANIPLEILYVGKSNRRNKIERINSIISAEQLSHIMPHVTLNWFFWVRLESMWHSKMQHSKSPDTDTIVQEIVKILSFDGSDQGWAVISRGLAEMAKANADAMLKSLARFDQWRGRAREVGFVPALNENLQELRSPHHCNRLILPSTAGKIPERVVCAECGRPMEKFFMYRCCTD